VLVVVALCAVCGDATSCKSQADHNEARVLAMLKEEQLTRHSVIGQNYHGHLEYFDASSSYKLRTTQLVTAGKEGPTIVLRDGVSNIPSSDGQWIGTCELSSCTVAERSNPTNRVSLSIKNLLTPLYWSSDGRLIFYLVKGPTWRSPSRCSLEDERDITVIEVATGISGVAMTVCGGFPYDQLRWYSLGADRQVQ
jgi:hypothetical protein